MTANFQALSMSRHRLAQLGAADSVVAGAAWNLTKKRTGPSGSTSCGSSGATKPGVLGSSTVSEGSRLAGRTSPVGGSR